MHGQRPRIQHRQAGTRVAPRRPGVGRAHPVAPGAVRLFAAPGVGPARHDHRGRHALSAAPSPGEPGPARFRMAHRGRAAAPLLPTQRHRRGAARRTDRQLELARGDHGRPSARGWGMNANDVIEAYVADVMRRLPRRDRREIGLELRGLLAEMLAERSVGAVPTDAQVLAMLQSFGTPAEVAARYRPPGMLIIPAEQSRSFAVMSLVGIALQWALTLPRVFQDQPLVTWWFSWGLGALWWPGFMAMSALAAAWLRQIGMTRTTWRPRVVDPDRVNRAAMAFGLAGFAVGVAFMVALPWIVQVMPEPWPQRFAFAPEFLQSRAWPVLVLWLGNFALLAGVLSRGRWSATTRWLELGFDIAWLILLGWWLAGGAIFQTAAADEGARGGLGLVMLFVAADLVLKLYRWQRRLRPLLPAG